MVKFFDDQQIAAVSEFVNNMIDSFGVVCKLFYQPIQTTASNTLLPVDDTYMKNVGLHGGIIEGNQYNEGAAGAVASQETENITLVVDWNIKDKLFFPAQMGIPYGVIKTHGYLTDLPKIQKCIEMQANLPTSPIVVGRYRLLGFGGDIFSIVPGRYFMCYWERIS